LPDLTTRNLRADDGKVRFRFITIGFVLEHSNALYDVKLFREL